MRITYSFDRLAVHMESIYFVDPDPYEGQEGPERGIRLEIREIQSEPHRGSVYASQRFILDEAYLRIDLLESVEKGPNARDRMHYHPGMSENEPGDRVFDISLSTDPIVWLSERLARVGEALTEAGIADLAPYETDIATLTEQSPMIVASADALLAKVRAGNLALGPDVPLR